MLRKNGNRSKWNLLYLVLAVLILLSVFAVPKIALAALSRTRGQIITVESTEN